MKSGKNVSRGYSWFRVSTKPKVIGMNIKRDNLNIATRSFCLNLKNIKLIKVIDKMASSGPLLPLIKARNIGKEAKK